jgi:hypothetical protein
LDNKQRICPLHKEDLINGIKIKYSHWFASLINVKSFFDDQKESFPRANVIKVVSCSKPEKGFTSGFYCKNCRVTMYQWWQKNVDENEDFEELIKLLKKEI